MMIVILAQSVAMAILWSRWHEALVPPTTQIPTPSGNNPIKRTYPDVDFTRIYYLGT